ncbi:class I SAM-dependent methyltransferase [Sphingomonas radiodurans]|uniref:class I SAM-dependent methyltransferase n=1 Tax=Sphingomonas radiodurans TaxID=2890321 RepID=UPI001E4744A6|nr:methyltransferase domain-containing protein [Sphingomonas radiodurans]WBH16836.1 methyltransferase domain-containing protein [Sphingomonas radiodurans]
MTAPAATLPLEYDGSFYRERHPDLATFDEEALATHYLDWGLAEGRVASPAAEREGFLDVVLGAETGTMLEIGPFCRPLVKGPNVRYLDVIDADALRQRAIEIGLDPSDCPAEIHYTGELAQIDDTFAAVVSSHAIEHQPDLVRHLQEVDRLLAPGGRYYLIIPDKRYCFDALIPESTIANVLYAHEQRRTVHSLQSVIEHRAMVTHNDPGMHWAGEHGPFPPDEQARRVRMALSEYEAADGGYIDVHAWYWTPEGFRQTMGVIHHLGLTRLRPARVYQTPRLRFEFCAVLEKTAD